MKTHLLFILSLILVLEFPQTVFSRSVEESLKMQTFSALLRGSSIGFKGDAKLSQAGLLRNGDLKAHKLKLKAGIQYLIVGICDDDCKDLDLVLFDENSNVVGKDTETREPPVIHVTPIRTATFTLGIEMASCTASPCGYGILVMKK